MAEGKLSITFCCPISSERLTCIGGICHGFTVDAFIAALFYSAAAHSVIRGNPTLRFERDAFKAEVVE